MTLEYVATQDGSLTLRQPHLDELYHNRAGAYSEALVNYALPAVALIDSCQVSDLHLLDSCFGLGYNTLVLLLQLIKLPRPITLHVTAVDYDGPMVAECLPRILQQDCFREFDQSEILAIGSVIKDQEWRSEQIDNVKLRSRLLVDDLRQVLAGSSIDANLGLVFHDPFSPARMTSLWTVEVFKTYRQLLQSAPGAILTYSSAPAVRGAMLDSGFAIYRTAKLGGKSGGTLALTAPLSAKATLDSIEPLSAEEQARLTTTSRVPYRDSHGKTPAEMRLSREREQKASGNN